jgi:hypothetical protein
MGILLRGGGGTQRPKPLGTPKDCFPGVDWAAFDRRRAGEFLMERRGQSNKERTLCPAAQGIAVASLIGDLPDGRHTRPQTTAAIEQGEA